MLSKILAKMPNAPDNEEMANFCEAIAEAVIEHVTANAEIGPGTFAAGGDAVTGAGVIS